MPERLAMSGVVRTFASGDGVRGVDLDVLPGQIHALVGLNGAGKTTLLRLALGMLRPQAGGIRIGGIPLEQAGPAEWAAVGHLVDAPLAYGELDARANLALAARLHAVPKPDVAHQIAAVFAELGLGAYAGRKVRALSLGNRQRLGLAAALVHGPQLIVLDEPTNSLDPRGVILLRESLLRRAEDGAGVLVSSHHLDEVARIADRISVLNAGKIIGGLDPHGINLERAFFDLVYADDERRNASGDLERRLP
ncbi:ABC transporter ATP-binding protein [Sinomonas sp. JGH33]|uniref:ABC transporter ATP-binding protein n=1 Tax=Sinomonas terricola TaxID=3110330 RepID=A0ABU5T671_9MICC|nr:ABC transporter ATP-binding protein [Sinomonas sp. JGH33]MEA5455140.1 ABC transporter ATP-binding protein [Sinomonas sp. JGH33]